MSTSTYDYIVIGAGVVGLATALALSRRERPPKILVLEKEAGLGLHQTGHNSGVIHSGIYYKPGSLKARLATAGCRSMAAFCAEQGIPHEICGKVIVATEGSELPRLEALYQRGISNGLALRRIGPEELGEMEPHVRGLAAIHVPAAGIVDYRQVAAAYGRILAERGAEILLSTEVTGVLETADGIMVESTSGACHGRVLINCAGLHADRVVRLSGGSPPFRIVPFRGEYFELRPDRRHLVRNLVYPVPDPSFPFLGVHLTRMIDGTLHAGPNAVLSLRREGYRKTDFALRDTLEVFTYPGFWRLAARHFGAGMRELHRSASKAAFVRSLQRLVPEIGADDLVPAAAGVRAQALATDGQLVDDFLIVASRRAVHVGNAPSPAATASLEIGEFVAERAAEVQASVA